MQYRNVKFDKKITIFQWFADFFDFKSDKLGINDYDPSNDFGDNATVFLSLYSKKDNKYYTKIVKVKNQSRELNKILLKDEFINLFKENIINQK